MAENRFDPVKIGVVGLGDFGRLHALTLAGLAEAELVALVARRQKSLDAVSGPLSELPRPQAPGGWLDLDAAIAESGAEAWVVAASTQAHVPITRALLSTGKPVLLEKPLAATLAEARTLEPLVRADSSNLMLGHILLFNSEFLQLQDEARQRGPIHFLSCVRHRPVATLDAFPGESPFHLTMVHDLYCALALMKRAESAHSNARMHRTVAELALDELMLARVKRAADPIHFSAQIHRTATEACDLALAQLVWENGTVASFEASFLTPEGMAADGFDRMELFGEGWMVRLSPNPRPIEIWDDRTRWPMSLEIRPDPAAPTGMLAEELRCFCRVVRGLQPVPVGATYGDAMQVQQWLDELEREAVG